MPYFCHIPLLKTTNWKSVTVTQSSKIGGTPHSWIFLLNWWRGFFLFILCEGYKVLGHYFNHEMKQWNERVYVRLWNRFIHIKNKKWRDTCQIKTLMDDGGLQTTNYFLCDFSSHLFLNPTDCWKKVQVVINVCEQQQIMLGHTDLF